MKIDSYSFGSIVIDGEEYNSDVLLYQGKVKSDWWRVEGHKLHIEDLGWLIAKRPKILIIGKGASGRMEVPQETIRKLEERGIKVIAENTEKAVRIYNELSQIKDKDVAAALHLTC